MRSTGPMGIVCSVKGSLVRCCLCYLKVDSLSTAPGVDKEVMCLVSENWNILYVGKAERCVEDEEGNIKNEIYLGLIF